MEHLKKIFTEKFIEELKNKKVSNDYWEKEALRMKEDQEQRKKEQDSLKMSFKKFHTPFTI